MKRTVIDPLLQFSNDGHGNLNASANVEIRAVNQRAGHGYANAGFASVAYKDRAFVIGASTAQSSQSTLRAIVQSAISVNILPKPPPRK